MGKVQELWVKFKSFIKESARVLTVTKKPTMEEYKTIVKVTGIGILVIGLLGFVITVVGQLLFNL